MQSLIVLLIQVLSGFIGYYIAIKKNKSPVLWFIIGFFFGLIGILILILLPETPNIQNKPPYRNQYSSKPNQQNETFEETIILHEDENQEEFDHWFFLNHEKQTLGPFSLKAICKNISKKEQPEKTWLWKKGMKNWQRLEEIPEALEQLKNIDK